MTSGSTCPLRLHHLHQHVSPHWCAGAHYQGCTKAEDSARPWMRAAEIHSHSIPCFALPLCALLAVQRASPLHFSFLTLTRTQGCCCVCACVCGRSCLQRAAPGSNCNTRICPSREQSVGLFFSLSWGKRRIFCNEVDVPVSKVRSDISVHWRNLSNSPFLFWWSEFFCFCFL